MTKNTFYFSHDLNTRNDEKVIDLMVDMGWEGYGLFWGIIELLYQNEGRMRTHYKRIAFALQTHEGSIKRIVEDFGLFKSDDEYFWSESVLRRLELRNTKSEKARKSAQKRWEDANALRPESDSNAIKERKINKRKENTLMSELDGSDDMDVYENTAFLLWKLIDTNLKKYGINSQDLTKAKHKNWVDPVRLAIESDGRTMEEFNEIYRFLESEIPKGDFAWSKVILSTGKLRANFEKVLLAASNNHDGNVPEPELQNLDLVE